MSQPDARELLKALRARIARALEAEQEHQRDASEIEQAAGDAEDRARAIAERSERIAEDLRLGLEDLDALEASLGSAPGAGS